MLDLVNPDARTRNASVTATLASWPDGAISDDEIAEPHRKQLKAFFLDQPAPRLPTEINIPSSRRRW